MKSKLTPEQSQRLIELGVDPSKASATIYIISETEVYCGYSREVIVTDGYITDYVSQEPLFTLSDILSLVPKEIATEAGKFQLSINIYKGEWLVGYDENEKEKIALFDVDTLANLYFVSATELIDALFELLCWTLTRETK